MVNSVIVCIINAKSKARRAVNLNMLATVITYECLVEFKIHFRFIKVLNH